LLGRIRQTTVGAYTHQDLPFDLLVTELQPDRNMSRTPIFQVKLEVEQVPPIEVTDHDQGIPLDPRSSLRHDLQWYLQDSGNRLHGAILYDRALFQAGTIVRMGKEFERILTLVAENPERTLSELTETLLATARKDQSAEDMQMERLGRQKLITTRRKAVITVSKKGVDA
jgi:non-ribosomal peptide synthetase component F